MTALLVISLPYMQYKQCWFYYSTYRTLLVLLELKLTLNA